MEWYVVMNGKIVYTAECEGEAERIASEDDTGCCEVYPETALVGYEREIFYEDLSDLQMRYVDYLLNAWHREIGMTANDEDDFKEAVRIASESTEYEMEADMNKRRHIRQI